MRKADSRDRGVWLLRLVFPSHLSDREPDFPPLAKVVQSAGEGAVRGISVYNMRLCGSVSEAFEHAGEARGVEPVYAVGITVGQCLDLGAEVWFNHGTGEGTHPYHAFIKTVGDKKTRGNQRKDIRNQLEANGKIQKHSTLPDLE